MTTIEPFLASGILPTLQQFVSATKLHPILVNFTAALVPVSVVSDLIARLWKIESLRNTGWWTLFYATLVTPLTALTGWLFWMPDNNDAPGMHIHKWLGTGLAVLLIALFIWRRQAHRNSEWPSPAYLLVGGVFIAAVTYQGYLGGVQVFSGM